MPNSLYIVFQAIANVSNEQQLRLALMDKIGEYFGVQHCGIYLIDEQPSSEINVQTIPAVCMENNPVGRYVVERHAPTHEQLILSPGDWKHFCSRHDHEHVMTGPIVCDGQLVGTLNLARNQGTEAFNADDIADLSALCIHLSAKLATLRAKEARISNSLLVSPLTARELEIAELVAQGLTNAEIGRRLWITQNSVKQALKRMFRKLGVSARSEMVAKLHLIALN
ncbi:LuxR C-terminal-related transcriptional regulator [Nodularia spumigena CS-584]|jgi:DNA-binding CsgD family transcriptional regulator/putative methionine-R-sulfoxide reductase with GAF domain|uniref:LuxR C-terminal-related transcriptional regulator n=1 Tax=Nodularia spumigena UHCC 0060 TaxID=3110300 RepID=A0ABU5V0G0_NODSP|nr:LuxR C-terminal-related transcriptional regulator [Nodularia spumigena]AHJ26623.1 transcriptional regulator [Nodularia spumigena CCY9414]EAW42947.1 Transcriptional Regulator with GAF sensor, LuxR family protein [Nodularia spumigena CCY9414]MDB9384635.1 LuxR C-terminal-related transcriptional regulator [Nodularia spumigena CS-584]MEA5524648.1 LuxR C-terminal-related transcriptional regulator [Nodularia spumigena UHCC 0143]MEA5556942.1 LuxR C-terminal-related transcriptional regulator [Nodula